MTSPVCTSPTRQSLSRKINKPLMEKRRRARINNSLNQLKHLVIDAMKNETTQMSKLEKADILEMTVTFLRNLQCEKRQESLPSNRSYTVGYSECAVEVMRVLQRESGISTEVRERLGTHIRHIANVHAQNSSKSAVNALALDISEHDGTSPGACMVDNRYNYLRLPLASAHLPVEQYGAIGCGLQNVYSSMEQSYETPCLSRDMLGSTSSSFSRSSNDHTLGLQVRRCLLLSPSEYSQSRDTPEVITGSQSQGNSDNLNAQDSINNNNNQESVWRPW